MLAVFAEMLALLAIGLAYAGGWNACCAAPRAAGADDAAPLVAETVLVRLFGCVKIAVAAVLGMIAVAALRRADPQGFVMLVWWLIGGAVVFGAAHGRKERPLGWSRAVAVRPRFAAFGGPTDDLGVPPFPELRNSETSRRGPVSADPQTSPDPARYLVEALEFRRGAPGFRDAVAVVTANAGTIVRPADEVSVSVALDCGTNEVVGNERNVEVRLSARHPAPWTVSAELSSEFPETVCGGGISL